MLKYLDDTVSVVHDSSSGCSGWQESQARRVEEELGRMEKQAAQTEARLRATVASLRQELDTLRRLHQNEVEPCFSCLISLTRL